MFAATAPHQVLPAWAVLRHNVRRAFGREPNPLCRRVDRSRSRLLVALVLTILASLAVAVLVGLTVLHTGQAGARQLAGHRHQATATTVSAATRDPSDVGTQARAQAVWDYPPTGRNSGLIAVPATTGPGGSVQIWVDDHGNAASAPPSDTTLVVNAGLSGFGTLAGAWLLVGAGYTARRRALDRRAECCWEPEWEQVEPLWSGRDRRYPESGQQ